jgi:hypothetical protein
VGFVFTANDPYCGIDLDDCRDEAGTLAAGRPRCGGAGELHRSQPVRPGRQGVRPGDQTGDRCRAATRAARSRCTTGPFFTVTGNILQNVSADVEERQAALDALYAKVFGPAVTPPL